ncbi:integrase core domain-containing protein [Mesorhizobium sp. M0590]|uniref:integrase core domain-containing protein n=1 Tax=Mesorhizobium sp. M0590 TaxID=2956966 RepID=UPI0033377C5A
MPSADAGKDERFHHSLKAEAQQWPPFADLAKAQDAFDRWGHVNNAQRPHDALDGGVPLDRYRASQRQYRETVEPFEYAKGDLIRRVQQHGFVSILGRKLRLCRAFAGKSVAFRPTAKDGLFDAWFRHQKIETIDLNASKR